ncbi:MAG: glycosyltransferase family 1 protein [bacterium]|nr:glycosyltransferase family 1 protein [bacterium]
MKKEQFLNKDPYEIARELKLSVGIKPEYITEEEIKELADDILEEIMTKTAQYFPSYAEAEKMLDLMEQGKSEELEKHIFKYIPNYDELFETMIADYIEEYQKFMKK